jgi:hypothetical protein
MNPFASLKTLLFLILLTMAVFLGIGLYIYFITTADAFLDATMAKLARLETTDYKWQYEAVGNLIRPGTTISGLGYEKKVHEVEGKLKGSVEGEIDLAAGGVPYTARAQVTAYDKQRQSRWQVEFDQIIIAGGSFIKINKAPGNEEIDLEPFVARWAETQADFFEQFAGWIRHDLVEQQVIDLRRLVADSRIFKFKEKLGYNFIGFTLVRGFSLELDAEPALDFVKNYKLITEGKGMTRSELRHVEEWINEVSDMEIEFWVGWSNKNLYRVQVSGIYEEANGSKVDFVWILSLDNHNKEVEIAAPENVQTAGDILRGAGGLPTAGEAEELPEGEEIITGESTELPVSAGEGATTELGFRDQDRDGLYDTFEFTLGTDPSNPDTDGDGVDDGDEVKEGTNPLGEGMLFEYR